MGMDSTAMSGKRGDPSIPSEAQLGPSTSNQRRRLPGHVTSDLPRGHWPGAGAADRGRAAALYVLARLKHNELLSAQTEPV